MNLGNGAVRFRVGALASDRRDILVGKLNLVLVAEIFMNIFLLAAQPATFSTLVHEDGFEVDAALWLEEPSATCACCFQNLSVYSVRL